MKNTSNHDITCACEECRELKGPYIYGEEPYELKQHKETKQYKYFKREKCPYCDKGYIIKTKLFDRCDLCLKDIKIESKIE